MKLVWMIIPLVLVGIIGIQDVDATVCHDFESIFLNQVTSPNVILIGTVESSEIIELDPPLQSFDGLISSERITEYKIGEQIYGDGVFELDTFTIKDSWANPIEPYEIGSQRVIPLYYYNTSSENQWNHLSCFVDFDIEYVSYVHWVKDLQKDSGFQFSYDQHAFTKYIKNNNQSQDNDVKPSTDKSLPKPTLATIKDVILSPKKQISQGIEPAAVKCNEGLVLITKKGGESSACVKPTTADILEERGWGGVNPPCCKK
jgi:hypothetical protein